MTPPTQINRRSPVKRALPSAERRRAVCLAKPSSPSLPSAGRPRTPGHVVATPTNLPPVRDAVVISDFT